MHHRTTLTCHCEERSDVAISQYPAGSQGTPGEYGNFTWHGVENAAPYKARAAGDHATKLGACKALRERRYTPYFGVCHFNGGRYGTAVPSRDCTPRALPRASRSGRHVGLWPPRKDNSGAFAILTAACTRRKCGAGSGMTLPYNGVCGRRECTEICRCATRRRGRRPLQRTAGSLGRFSAFRLPRAFLSCQIQKSDRLIWVSRSGF